MLTPKLPETPSEANFNKTGHILNSDHPSI